MYVFLCLKEKKKVLYFAELLLKTHYELSIKLGLVFLLSWTNRCHFWPPGGAVILWTEESDWFSCKPKM